MKSDNTEANLDNLLTIFNDTTVDNVNLEKQITITLQNWSDNLIKNDFPQEKIRNVFESAAVWILKNFSNPLLTFVINFISTVLTKLNYRIEIKKEEIISILNLETYDQILKNDDEKEKEKSKMVEILKDNSIITNQFLSTFYALILTISNKPAIIAKSKNLLKSIANVFCQICEIDNIAIYYKKKRLIKVFGKILKELRKANETESLLLISKILMYLFSKIGKKRPVYRDYMLKKGITDLIIDTVLQIKKIDSETIKVFGIFCYFTTRTVDHKTYFWTKGVINFLLDNLMKNINEIKNEECDNNVLEYITLSLVHLSLENYDVQMEIKEKNFIELAKTILMKYSKNNFLIFNVVSILRRIKDDEFEVMMTTEFLYTFFALFDYFYLSSKQNYKESSKTDVQFDLLILKELVAILGNIVKEEIHKKPFLEKNFHIVMLDIKLSFNFYPKLVKNTIGALINLTTSDEIRENLSKVAAFIQSIYLILDKYQSNQAIMDYELKLIMNVLKNEITVKTFIGGDMFLYLIYFMKNFLKNDEIVFNSIKITRNLILKKKGFEEFILKIQEFYKTLYGQINEKTKFLGLYVADLIYLLDTKIDSINICVETLLLLSYLTNQDEDFKKILESSDIFMKGIQKIISVYSNDEKISKLISQCIAQLPIEEFDAVKYN